MPTRSSPDPSGLSARATSESQSVGDALGWSILFAILQAWQKETGYRQQGRVEGTFLRYKRTLGGSLRGKGLASQKLEARLGCLVLNKMYELGKAQSYAVMS